MPNKHSHHVDPAKRRRTRGYLYAGLSIGLVLAIFGSAMSGQLALTPAEVFGAIGRALGLQVGAELTPLADATLWNIRFPRIVFAVLVGAALAVAGLMMQAIFANPLAEPGVIGVSSGAALGAAAFLVFGTLAGFADTQAFGAEIGMAVSAFAAGLGTTMLVYAVSRRHGRTEVVTLVLTGIAVNAFAAGGLAFSLFAATTATREQLIFWQLGSLNGASWGDIAIVAPILALGIVTAAIYARSYDALSLGERNAGHIGVNVERVRLVSIVIVAVLAAGAVAFAGIISFVGLIIPHLMRLAIGPAHRPLLISSALGGALLLLAADWIARTAVPFADLPIGMLTSLIGGPFFLWLLVRTRSKMGGFA